MDEQTTAARAPGKYGEPWGPAADYKPWETSCADMRELQALPDEERRAEKARRARRAEACVNACEGIEDPAELRRQRDDALQACEYVDRWLMAGWSDADARSRTVREEFGKALEKVRAVLRAAGMKTSGPEVPHG